jgi:hypothetical protein
MCASYKYNNGKRCAHGAARQKCSAALRRVRGSAAKCRGALAANGAATIQIPREVY